MVSKNSTDHYLHMNESSTAFTHKFFVPKNVTDAKVRQEQKKWKNIKSLAFYYATRAALLISRQILFCLRPQFGSFWKLDVYTFSPSKTVSVFRPHFLREELSILKKEEVYKNLNQEFCQFGLQRNVKTLF